MQMNSDRMLYYLSSSPALVLVYSLYNQLMVDCWDSAASLIPSYIILHACLDFVSPDFGISAVVLFSPSILVTRLYQNTVHDFLLYKPFRSRDTVMRHRTSFSLPACRLPKKTRQDEVSKS